MLAYLKRALALVVVVLLPCMAHADMFPLGKDWSGTFTTYNSSGALTNADSTPTCSAYIGSNSTAINSGTVTNISAGFYRYTITMSAGNGFAADNSYSVTCLAVVGGTTQRVHHQDGIYLLATPQAAGILQADVQRWGGQIMNALTSGRVEALVGAMGTSVITNTAFAANSVKAAALDPDVTTEVQTNLITFPKNVAFTNYKFYLSKAGVDYNIGSNSTITCEIIKDGGSLGACDSTSQSSITFVSKGVYKMNLAASDMNVNNSNWIRLYVPTDTAVSVWQQQLVPGH